MDEFKMKVVCRACFNAYARDDCLLLSSPSGLVTLKTIEKVMKNVISEMNTSLIKDSAVCITCWEHISQFYKLKVECLQNEQSFFEFLAKNDWQGTINDFVFSGEPMIYDNVAKVEFEVENDDKPIIDDADFLLSYQECTLDDVSEDEATVPLEISNEEQSVVKDTNDKLEEDKILSCSSCLAECKNFMEALYHATECHGIHVVLSCKYCSTFYMDSESLEAHLLKTHNKEFSCGICGTNFVNRQSLAKHAKTHPEYVALKNQKEFKCQYCSLVFKSKRPFNRHMRTHQRRLYTCEVCGKSHANNMLLEEHRLIHSNIKRYMCEKCGKCFKQKSLLWWHNYKYHLSVKTKQCPHCPKKFFRTYDLNVHQIVHTGERNYHCHVCLKSFTRPDNVRRHMVVHTGEKFQCKTCGRSYSQVYDLRRHSCVTGTKNRRKTGGSSKKCEKNYNQAGIQKQHQAPSQIETVKCKICDNVFKKAYIKYHVRTHTGEKPELCNVCGKSFASFANRARHMMTHTGEKRFRCEECDCSFIQKVQYDSHMRRRHTGEKPYECKVCDRRFVEFSVLQRHKRTRAHRLALENTLETS